MWNVYGRSKPNYPAAINKVGIMYPVAIINVVLIFEEENDCSVDVNCNMSYR